MPITRSSTSPENAATDVMSISSEDSFTAIDGHYEAPPLKPNSSRSLTRTMSSPAAHTASTSSETSSLYGSHNSIPSKSHGPRSSSGSTAGTSMRISLSSNSSFASPLSFRKGGGDDDEDDSDDDENRFNAYRRGRLGGCSRLSEAQKDRDDSNKENVAPLRRLSQRSIVSELAAQQEDGVARRTRTRPAAPMSDRSESQTDVRNAQRDRRAAFRRTVSYPVSRKRSRPTETDSSGQADEDGILSGDLPSPANRPRLDSDDQESCYYSSQATSIFDVASSVCDEASPFSRCTTPEPSEADAAEKGNVPDGLDDETSEVSSEQQYSNIFVHARALLRNGASTEIHIVGRDRERGCLQRFLQSRFGIFNHLEHSAMPNGEALGPNMDLCIDNGSMYVCGLPGTGKTALVRSILNDVDRIWNAESLLGSGLSKRRVAFIDCMSIQHPRELFKRILITLEENISTLPAGDAGDVEAEKRVVGIVRDARQQTLIVLDEIDHLLGSRLYQNILYRLFSWPQRDTKTCAVIGLANSLDLTERFVPLLASKGAAPSVLHFRPFEAAEIKQVIGARLALLRSSYEQDAESNNEEDFDAVHQDECNAPTFFTAPALELLARKVAAATGDLRKALDTCRLAIEAVESEMTAKAQAGSAGVALDLRSFNPTNVPRVLPAHILKVLSTVLGSPQLTKIRSLSLQPKLALLALLIAQKRAEYNLCVLGGGASSAVGPSTMGGVYASDTSGTLLCDVATTYTQMLKNDDFAALEGKELIDVLEGLEVEGVVRIVGVNGKAVTENGSQSERGSGASIVVRTNNISPSAKRAAKRQLLASYRRVQLVISVDDVIKGICTPPPPSRSSSVSGSAASGTVVLDAIKRIWSREEFNAERARGWQTSKALAQRIRDEELGGGRGALANI